MVRYNIDLHFPYKYSSNHFSHSLILTLSSSSFSDMSQNQGDVQLKNESDKKKAKSPAKWHIIECDCSVKKKKQFKGVGVQPVKAEEERNYMLFQSSIKSKCSRDRRRQPN